MNQLVASPPQLLASANMEFDTFMLQFTALESVAIEENYSVRDRITAFRKIYYNSESAAQTYAGATLGMDYYSPPSGDSRHRHGTFAEKIGLGTLGDDRFSGDTPQWRRELQEQIFNAALAYAAATGRRGDVVLILADPGPDFSGLTPRQAYWNVARWVADLFVTRMAGFVGREPEPKFG
jgi:hypothetical protein